MKNQYLSDFDLLTDIKDKSHLKKYRKISRNTGHLYAENKLFYKKTVKVQ